ncbi:styrene monooxygenase/indole monooxygenase family protein [Nocardia sp. NPDC052112]|uniref:styrene monooxygenase/indole monooxygenase family protein n=1 Tax=Nocardia sp. NPDC052112 TaxID=3155646 RepID=UPI00341F970C
MRGIQILGAGECGLPLALRLRHSGVPVTLVTDRDAAAVLSGSVTSTQVKFQPTLELESRAGLGVWRSSAPRIQGIRFNLVIDRNLVSGWAGRFSEPAQSVDQRTVFAHWLAEFAAVGGSLEIAELSVPQLDRRAAEFDLTVVSRASRDLAACFPADASWSVPTEPMRRLAVLYLDGVEPDPDGLGTYIALPGHGEIISYPGLTGPPGQERRCEILLFEGVPDRGLDAFANTVPAERLPRAAHLLQWYLPAALADRYRNAELTDGGATLVGAVGPTMREPIGTLPSGALVLGGGDVVCRMDPGGAQGANSAAHCAAQYSAAILGNPTGPFDRAWMTSAAQPWLTAIAHPAARWTLAVLDPPTAVRELMLAAQDDTTLADAFAETFVRPANMVGFAAAASAGYPEPDAHVETAPH